MFSPSAVAILLWALAEYLIFRVLADALGVGSALLVTFAASALAVLVGWAKFRFFVADTVRSAVSESIDGGTGNGGAGGCQVAADRLVRIIAFVLCVVPGLGSGLIGLALLVPSIRRRAAARLAPRLTTASSFSFGGFPGFGQRSTGSHSHGDVIDTDVVDVDGRHGEAHDPHPSARSELG